MNHVGVEPARAVDGAQDNPAQALVAVADSAAGLLRAELRLAAAEARAWLVRISLGLALLWLALLLTQVFVLLVALTATLWSTLPWTRLALMLGLSLAPALAAFGFAARELARMKEALHGSKSQHEH